MLKLGLDNAEISGDARHVVAVGKGKKKMSGERQSIDGAKEKFSIPKSGQSLFFQSKNQIGHPTGKMYVDPKCLFRPKSGINPILHARSSQRDGRSSVVHSACNNEELVMHMSNVPSFLQRVEKEDSVQEKALNFGVLDWKKLETWKYNERMPKLFPKKKPLSSNSLSSPLAQPKMSPNLRKHSSPQNVVNPGIHDLGKQHLMHAPHYLSPSRQPTSTPSSSQLDSLVKGRSSFFRPEKKCRDGITPKEKEPCNRKSQSSWKSSVDNPRKNCKLVDKGFSDGCGKNNLENHMLSKKVALSSERRFNHKLSSSSQENSKMTLNGEEMCTAERCPMESQKISVLAVPKHSREGSFSGSSQVTESATYLDEQLAEAIRNKLLDLFSPQELYAEELVSSTRHSCPLPSRVTTDKKPVINQRFGKKGDKNSGPIASSVKPKRSEGKTSMMHEKPTPHHPASVDVRPSEKGSYLSPSRFRFNLGKMSRSFSFKEISVIPQMKSTNISVRSGPVTPEVSRSMDGVEGKRDNSKGRSSPLRRLLDPLLKHKVAQSSTSETSRSSKGRPNFMTFMTNPSKRQSQDSKKKPGVTVHHALVQFTLKNGLCFFEFVVDDKNDMLAAAVNRSPTTEKGDPCLIYTFYSVNEVRKKGTNWMSHGSKDRSGNLGYNAVGQMIMSTSDHSDTLECILYRAASGQAKNEKTPESESIADTEIAAVVVRCSNKSTTHEAREDENFNNAALILPGVGGGHGTPVKGTPTSLISRWKSNGTCDCGGWDIGCKLRILTDRKNESNFGPSPTPNSIVRLFQQGEKEKRDHPLLGLEPLNNGYYSVSLDASISFLEAFATSVAHITCREFPELVAAKLHSAGNQKANESNAFQGGKIPGNYVACPPLSPAGRI